MRTKLAYIVTPIFVAAGAAATIAAAPIASAAPTEPDCVRTALMTKCSSVGHSSLTTTPSSNGSGGALYPFRNYLYPY